MLDLILKAIGTATWTALAIESTAAVACLLAITSRRRQIALNIPAEQRTQIEQLRRHPEAGDAGDRHVKSLRAWLLEHTKIQEVVAATRGSDIATTEREVSLYVHKQAGSVQSLLRFLILSAPFLGLLGTVQGVVSTLATFASQPGDPRAMFTGISFALFTTLCGMVIALVAMSSRALAEHSLSALTEDLLGIALALCPATPSKTLESARQTQTRKKSKSVSTEQSEQPADQSEAKSAASTVPTPSPGTETDATPTANAATSDGGSSQKTEPATKGQGITKPGCNVEATDSVDHPSEKATAATAKSGNNGYSVPKQKSTPGNQSAEKVNGEQALEQLPSHSHSVVADSASDGPSVALETDEVGAQIEAQFGLKLPPEVLALIASDDRGAAKEKLKAALTQLAAGRPVTVETLASNCDAVPRSEELEADDISFAEHRETSSDDVFGDAEAAIDQERLAVAAGVG